MGSQYLAMAGLVVYIIPPAAAPFVIASAVYFFVSVAVNRTNRELKREANACMGPLQSNLAEAQHARTLADVMGCQRFFLDRGHRFANNFNRANYAAYCLLSWMQMVGVYVSFFISVSVGVYVIVFQQQANVSPEMSALVLTYTFSMPYLMQMIALILTNLQVFFTSLERIKEFESLPQEPPHVLPSDRGLAERSWPWSGAISCVGTSLQYARDANKAPAGPRVLDGITLEIAAGDRVGVVGRTGAGKSSMMSVLFRLVDPTEGTISIDGVDTASVGLTLLRRNIAIIPQDPILMKGTVRYNLDPFNNHNDEEIRDVMTRAHLNTTLLSAEVESGGIGLSVGQRQLICLARAILTRAPIILMDEPTASCDVETDELIQAMIRREFAASTCITIAHRLQTVIDSDKILVLSNGRVVEYGKPTELLQAPDGAFSAMVTALGKGASDHIRAKAIACTTKKNEANAYD
jgi:ATP-binding cassette subfamily C (CFTR/MRP) protein 1